MAWVPGCDLRDLGQAVRVELERLSHGAAERPGRDEVASQADPPLRVILDLPGSREDETVDGVSFTHGRHAMLPAVEWQAALEELADPWREQVRPTTRHPRRL